MIRTLILLLVSGFAMASAAAQMPTECPENAEQVLTNIRLSIGTPNQPSTEDIYNNAKTASSICEGRTHAQALAADILTLVATAAEDPANQRFFLGLAHLAIQRSDQAYDSGTPNVTVTLPNGTPHTLYTYGSTTELLKAQVMPRLLAAAKDGEVHAIFTTETLDACPYSMKADEQARARAEADALNSWGYSQAQDNFQFGVTRLTALKQACPGQAQYLTYALGTYYAQAAHYRSMNDDYPAAEWASKADTLLNQFIVMEHKRSDDRTTVGAARVQLEKARAVLAEATP